MLRLGLRALALLAMGGCATRQAPPNNAARPIQVDLHVSGWRAEEAQYRLEQKLVEDPSIGLGGRTTVFAHVERNLCSIGFGIRGEGVGFGVWIHGSIRDEDDFDECLRLLVPDAAKLLARRLHLPRYQSQPSSHRDGANAQ